MIMQVYSLFDRASGAFGGPILAVNDSIMRRSLTELLQAGQGDNISRYPDEFDVYKLGSFNTDDGTLLPQQPSMMFRVSSLLPAQQGN